MKIKQVEEKTDENDQKIQTLFKKINTSFTEFREKVDNLEKNNEKILTEKINYKDEIDTRINNCKNDIKEIKIFCQSQIKEMEENYKKEIMRANDQNKDLPLELSKKTMDLKEQIKLKEVFENKLKESENRINDLNNIIEVSKKSLNTKDELIKMYQDKINNDKKKINDLEISLSQNIYNYKMAEDDFETLLIIFQGILQKDKEKYLKNVKKLSSKGKKYVLSLIEKYNVFSDL
jgi:chromosome segregation ATPase